MPSVRLPVVPDAERPELCGDGCAYQQTNLCTLRGVVQRDAYHRGRDGLLPGPEDFTKPPTWRRTDYCVAATALDEKERAVIEAAKQWSLDEAGPRDALHAAVDALVALGAGGKS